MVFRKEPFFIGPKSAPGKMKSSLYEENLELLNIKLILFTIHSSPNRIDTVKTVL